MILCSIIVLDDIAKVVFEWLFNYKISDRILYKLVLIKNKSVDLLNLVSKIAIYEVGERS